MGRAAPQRKPPSVRPCASAWGCSPGLRPLDSPSPFGQRLSCPPSPPQVSPYLRPSSVRPKHSGILAPRVISPLSLGAPSPPQVRCLKDRVYGFLVFPLLEPCPGLDTKHAFSVSVVYTDACMQDRGQVPKGKNGTLKSEIMRFVDAEIVRTQKNRRFEPRPVLPADFQACSLLACIQAAGESHPHGPVALFSITDPRHSDPSFWEGPRSKSGSAFLFSSPRLSLRGVEVSLVLVILPSCHSGITDSRGGMGGAGDEEGAREQKARCSRSSASPGQIRLIQNQRRDVYGVGAYPEALPPPQRAEQSICFSSHAHRPGENWTESTTWSPLPSGLTTRGHNQMEKIVKGLTFAYICMRLHIRTRTCGSFSGSFQVDVTIATRLLWVDSALLTRRPQALSPDTGCLCVVGWGEQG